MRACGSWLLRRRRRSGRSMRRPPVGSRAMLCASCARQVYYSSVLRIAIAPGVLLLAAAALLFPQGKPRKSPEAEHLAIDAVVTDAAGHAASGLTAADFE